ncbi:MAG: transcriptional coactivator p15/PC4 family protein [Proteobacteria bacterium]|jgi:hypothetical protein|nr:transcriptional coactivator p15/PC4 family protein [Pseudomonadota bacterium]
MLVGETEKNARERIRISIEEYRGHKFIDCRTYFKDTAGEMKPSRKGIALNEDVIDEVLELLNKAREKLLEE